MARRAVGERLGFALGWLALGWMGCGSPPSLGPDAAVDAAVDTKPSGTPDLTVYAPRLLSDMAAHDQVFAPDACELHPDEACIGAAGVRRLLRFAIETPNVGTADLELGRPGVDNELFQFSECHGHYHFLGYAAYELLDGDGKTVVTGRKQAFCLVDTHPFEDGDEVAASARYSCSFQGIQRGWSDVYHSGLPCQFLDVTGVPDGDYTLRVRVNEAGTLPELSADNNQVEVAVTLGDPALSTPTEPCPPGDEHALGQPGRECGWRAEEPVACTPGVQLRLGCASSCGLGACTGDVMLRVCDASGLDANCAFGTALGTATGACGSTCPAIVGLPCPASGQLSVFTAPRQPGADYSCELAVIEL